MEETQTIESKMRSMLRERGRGAILFPDDFACLESPLAVRQVLCSMVKEGTLVRLARGIYSYPRVSGAEYAASYVLPDNESIAYALAAKENVRIIPYGDQAAHKLGLSSLVISSDKYLTDGSPRTINLSATKKIYFNHTSEVKMFAFHNETMQLLCSAVRALGAEYFEDRDVRYKVREILAGITDEDFDRDITLPPAWVGKIISDIRNK